MSSCASLSIDHPARKDWTAIRKQRFDGIEAIRKGIQKSDAYRSIRESLRIESIQNPNDPLVPPGGMESKIGRRVMTGWSICESSIEAMNQLPSSLWLDIVQRLPVVIFMDARQKNRWFRIRQIKARSGIPHLHDQRTGKTMSLFPTTTRDTGQKYDAMLYSDIICERFRDRIPEHLMHAPYNRILNWLATSPLDKWELISAKPIPLLASPVMNGTSLDNRVLFGTDPTHERDGLYVHRGHLKKMPNSKKMADNYPILCPPAGKAAKMAAPDERTASHCIEIRSVQIDTNGYHSTATLRFHLAPENLKRPKLSQQVTCVINHMDEIQVHISSLFLLFGIPLQLIHLFLQQRAGFEFDAEFYEFCDLVARSCPCEQSQYGAVKYIMSISEAKRASIGSYSYGAEGFMSQETILTEAEFVASIASIASPPLSSPSSSSSSSSSGSRSTTTPSSSVTGLATDVSRLSHGTIHSTTGSSPLIASVSPFPKASPSSSSPAMPASSLSSRSSTTTPFSSVSASSASSASSHLQAAVEDPLAFDHRITTLFSKLAKGEETEEDIDSLYTMLESGLGSTAAGGTGTPAECRYAKASATNYAVPKFQPLCFLSSSSFVSSAPHGGASSVSNTVVHQRGPTTANGSGRTKEGKDTKSGEGGEEEEEEILAAIGPSTTTTPAGSLGPGPAPTTEKKRASSSSSAPTPPTDAEIARVRFAHYLLSNSLLPGIGNADFHDDKAQTLGELMWILYMAFKGRLPADERDHQPYCRYSLERDTNASLHRQLLSSQGRLGKKRVVRHMERINTIHLMKLHQPARFRSSASSTSSSSTAVGTSRPSVSSTSASASTADDDDNMPHPVPDAVMKHAMSKSEYVASTLHQAQSTAASARLGSYNSLARLELTPVQVYEEAFRNKRNTARIDSNYKTGNWQSSPFRKPRSGVVVSVKPTNAASLDAYESLLTSSAGRHGNITARAVDNAQQGRIDGSHTPEGEDCGHNVHRSFSQFSLGSSSRQLIRVLMSPTWRRRIRLIPNDAFWDICHWMSTTAGKHAFPEHAAQVRAKPLRSSSYCAPSHVSLPSYLIHDDSVLVGDERRATRPSSFSSSSSVSSRRRLGRQLTDLDLSLDTLATLDIRPFFANLRRVYVGGIPIGWIHTRRIQCYVDVIRLLRTSKRIPDPMVSASERKLHRVVHTFTDAGRLMQPVAPIASYQRARRRMRVAWDHITFAQMCAMGFIDWIDASESEDTVHTIVATSSLDVDNMLKRGIRPTHVVLHPMLQYDTVTNSIPNVTSNSGARATYAASHKKAAPAPYTDELLSHASHRYRLVVPQKPLVTTTATDVRPELEQVSGQHALTFIMPKNGKGVDDPYVLSDAHEFGSFQVESVITYRHFQKRAAGMINTERIERPDHKCLSRKDIRSDGLAARGVPPVGTVLAHTAPAIGITSLVQSKGNQPSRRRECSVLTTKEAAHVVSSGIRVSSDGLESAHVTVSSYRATEPGNKFSKLSAQKGICQAVILTIDMEFGERTGEQAMVLQSPMALPTRQTCGHIQSGIHAFARALDPTAISAFANAMEHREDLYLAIGETLVKHGCNPRGTIRVRNAVTGRVIDSPVFRCMLYMIPLANHNAGDTGHASGMAPIQPKTLQPIPAYRIGRMETNTIHSNNAPMVAHHSLTTKSDFERLFICEYCGRKSGKVSFKERRLWCDNCQTGEGICTVESVRGGDTAVSDQDVLGLCSRYHLQRTGRYANLKDFVGPRRFATPSM